METPRRWLALALCMALLVPTPAEPATAAGPRCVPTLRVIARFPGRVDSLLPAGSGGALIALVGPPSGTARFLPRDRLIGVAADLRPRWSVQLPPYITPPGLTLGDEPGLFYAVVDSELLTFGVATGGLEARRRLDIQALGWPAAVAAERGRLYVAGQPTVGWAAQVEAIPTGTHAAGPVQWRAKLGLTHAGTWIGRAGRGLLAVYLPDAHDATGSIALIDERTGASRPVYTVPAPALAADPARDRLYVDGAGSIAALTLDRGRPVASVLGQPPLALAPARGLLAVTQGNGVTLASARTLRPLGHLALPGITALAASPDGATLLVGLRGGLARIDFGGCAAA